MSILPKLLPFKRRTPAHRATPAPDVSPQDKVVAAHHKMTPEEWDKLPNRDKQGLRESVAWELREAS